jgi:polyphosphate kinase
VRSIVGRYLEHSRIYHFANGAGPGRPACYIGSADLMPRNLDRRVEALVPVEDPVLRAELEEVLEVNLADDTLAWELGPGGDWRRLLDSDGGTVDTHLALHVLTGQRERAHG